MTEAANNLCKLWHNIEVEQVIRTDLPSLASIGGRWIRDLSFGGLMSSSGVRANHLLDTNPLRELLRRNIDFGAIEKHLASDLLHGFAVSATNYHTGTAISFYDGNPKISPWARSSRLGRRTRIQLHHVLASASIPIMFAPVPVEGSLYGDGGIRMNTPLSPAIHMGADRVVAISIRHPRTHESTEKLNQVSNTEEISVADIAGVMLNATFLDGLDADAERMDRINQTIRLMTEEQRRNHPSQLREIPLLVIRPSVDLGALASDQFMRFPRALRYLMKGIGASDERGSDFVSYLAFDPNYTRPLLEIGRSDVLDQREQIEAFFLSSE